MIKIDINKIIRETIQKLLKSFSVSEVVNNDDGSFTLSVDNNDYIYSGCTIENSGVNYQVSDADESSITILSDSTPAIGSYNEVLHYHYGYAVDISNLNLNRKKHPDKWPAIIYIHTDESRTDHPRGQTDVVGAEYRIWVAAMTSLGQAKDVTKSKQDDTIELMYRYMKRFNDRLKWHPDVIGDGLSGTVFQSHRYWGVVDQTRPNENIFGTDRLSGVDTQNYVITTY